jgi:hypothetical protein
LAQQLQQQPLGGMHQVRNPVAGQPIVGNVPTIQPTIAKSEPFSCCDSACHAHFPPNEGATPLPARVLWEGTKGIVTGKTNRQKIKEHSKYCIPYWFAFTKSQRDSNDWTIASITAHVLTRIVENSSEKFSSGEEKEQIALLRVVRHLRRQVPAFIAAKKHEMKKQVFKQRNKLFAVNDKVGAYLPNIERLVLQILWCYEENILRPDFAESIHSMDGWRVLNKFYLGLCSSQSFERETAEPFIDNRKLELLRSEQHFHQPIEVDNTEATEYKPKRKGKRRRL